MSFQTDIHDFVKLYGHHQTKTKKICSPAYSVFGLEYFLYTFISTNGQIFSVGTDITLLEFYFERQLYKHDPMLVDPRYVQNQLSYIHSSMLDSPFRCLSLPFMREFNHDNILLYQTKDNFGAHHYVFATNKNKGCIVNYYLNNLERLKVFISYFQTENKAIIKKGISTTQLNLFTIPNHFLDPTNFEPNTLFDFSTNGLFKTSDNIDISSITPREWDCLKLCIQAKSSKESAKLLGISPRTVEFHLDNLKTKFNCKNKKELISKASFIFYGE